MTDEDRRRPRPRSRIRKQPIRRNIDGDIEVEFDEHEIMDGFPDDQKEQSDGRRRHDNCSSSA